MKTNFITFFVLALVLCDAWSGGRCKTVITLGAPWFTIDFLNTLNLQIQGCRKAPNIISWFSQLYLNYFIHLTWLAQTWKVFDSDDVDFIMNIVHDKTFYPIHAKSQKKYMTAFLKTTYQPVWGKKIQQKSPYLLSLFLQHTQSPGVCFNAQQ